MADVDVSEDTVCDDPMSGIAAVGALNEATGNNRLSRLAPARTGVPRIVTFCGSDFMLTALAASEDDVAFTGSTFMLAAAGASTFIGSVFMATAADNAGVIVPFLLDDPATAKAVPIAGSAFPLSAVRNHRPPTMPPYPLRLTPTSQAPCGANVLLVVAQPGKTLGPENPAPSITAAPCKHAAVDGQ